MSERRSRRTRGERPELVPPKSDEEPDLEDDYVDEHGNAIAVGAIRGRRRGRRGKSSNKGSSSSLSQLAEEENKLEQLEKKNPNNKKGPPKPVTTRKTRRSPTPSQSSVSSSVSDSVSVDEGDTESFTNPFDFDESDDDSNDSKPEDVNSEMDGDDDAERDTEDDAPKEALSGSKKSVRAQRKHQQDQSQEPAHPRYKNVMKLACRHCGKLCFPQGIKTHERSCMPVYTPRDENEKMPKKLRKRKGLETSGFSSESIHFSVSSGDSSDTSSPPSPVIIVRRKAVTTKKTTTTQPQQKAPKINLKICKYCGKKVNSRGFTQHEKSCAKKERAKIMAENKKRKRKLPARGTASVATNTDDDSLSDDDASSTGKVRGKFVDDTLKNAGEGTIAEDNRDKDSNDPPNEVSLAVPPKRKRRRKKFYDGDDDEGGSDAQMKVDDDESNSSFGDNIQKKNTRKQKPEPPAAEQSQKSSGRLGGKRDDLLATASAIVSVTKSKIQIGINAVKKGEKKKTGKSFKSSILSQGKMATITEYFSPKTKKSDKQQQTKPALFGDGGGKNSKEGNVGHDSTIVPEDGASTSSDKKLAEEGLSTTNKTNDESMESNDTIGKDEGLNSLTNADDSVSKADLDGDEDVASRPQEGHPSRLAAKDESTKKEPNPDGGAIDREKRKDVSAVRKNNAKKTTSVGRPTTRKKIEKKEKNPIKAIVSTRPTRKRKLTPKAAEAAAAASIKNEEKRVGKNEVEVVAKSGTVLGKKSKTKHVDESLTNDPSLEKDADIQSVPSTVEQASLKEQKAKAGIVEAAKNAAAATLAAFSLLAGKPNSEKENKQEGAEIDSTEIELETNGVARPTIVTIPPDSVSREHVAANTVFKPTIVAVPPRDGDEALVKAIEIDPEDSKTTKLMDAMSGTKDVTTPDRSECVSSVDETAPEPLRKDSVETSQSLLENEEPIIDEKQRVPPNSKAEISKNTIEKSDTSDGTGGTESAKEISIKEKLAPNIDHKMGGNENIPSATEMEQTVGSHTSKNDASKEESTSITEHKPSQLEDTLNEKGIHETKSTRPISNEKDDEAPQSTMNSISLSEKDTANMDALNTKGGDMPYSKKSPKGSKSSTNENDDKKLLDQGEVKDGASLQESDKTRNTVEQASIKEVVDIKLEENNAMPSSQHLLETEQIGSFATVRTMTTTDQPCRAPTKGSIDTKGNNEEIQKSKEKGDGRNHESCSSAAVEEKGPVTEGAGAESEHDTDMKGRAEEVLNTKEPIAANENSSNQISEVRAEPSADEGVKESIENRSNIEVSPTGSDCKDKEIETTGERQTGSKRGSHEKLSIEETSIVEVSPIGSDRKDEEIENTKERQIGSKTESDKKHSAPSGVVEDKKTFDKVEQENEAGAVSATHESIALEEETILGQNSEDSGIVPERDKNSSKEIEKDATKTFVDNSVESTNDADGNSECKPMTEKDFHNSVGKITEKNSRNFEGNISSGLSLTSEVKTSEERGVQSNSTQSNQNLSSSPILMESINDSIGIGTTSKAEKRNATINEVHDSVPADRSSNFVKESDGRKDSNPPVDKPEHLELTNSASKDVSKGDFMTKNDNTAVSSTNETKFKEQQSAESKKNISMSNEYAGGPKQQNLNGVSLSDDGTLRQPEKSSKSTGPVEDADKLRLETAVSKPTESSVSLNETVAIEKVVDVDSEQKPVYVPEEKSMTSSMNPTKVVVPNVVLCSEDGDKPSQERLNDVSDENFNNASKSDVQMEKVMSNDQSHEVGEPAAVEKDGVLTKPSNSVETGNVPTELNGKTDEEEDFASQASTSHHKKGEGHPSAEISNQIGYSDHRDTPVASSQDCRLISTTTTGSNNDDKIHPTQQDASIGTHAKSESTPNETDSTPRVEVHNKKTNTKGEEVNSSSGAENISAEMQSISIVNNIDPECENFEEAKTKEENQRVLPGQRVTDISQSKSNAYLEPSADKKAGSEVEKERRLSNVVNESVANEPEQGSTGTKASTAKPSNLSKLHTKSSQEDKEGQLQLVNSAGVDLELKVDSADAAKKVATAVVESLVSSVESRAKSISADVIPMESDTSIQSTQEAVKANNIHTKMDVSDDHVDSKENSSTSSNKLFQESNLKDSNRTKIPMVTLSTNGLSEKSGPTTDMEPENSSDHKEELKVSWVAMSKVLRRSKAVEGKPKPIIYGNDKLNRIKMLLYTAGSQVHRGRGYERIFGIYWDALRLRVSCQLNSNTSKRCEEAISHFLKSKKLRKIHNKFIMSIMRRTFKNRVRYSEINEHVPLKMQNRVKVPQLTKMPKKKPVPFGGFREQLLRISDVPHHDKISPYKEQWEFAVDAKDQIQQAPQDGPTVPIASSCIPGALVVDPFLRETVDGYGMKVTDNAMWLLTVALKEHIKSILNDSIEYKKGLIKGRLLPQTIHYPNVLANTSNKNRKASKGRSSVSSLENGRKKQITSIDLFAALNMLPSGQRSSIGGSVSRMSLEQTFLSGFNSIPSFEKGNTFKDVQNFISNTISVMAKNHIPEKKVKTSNSKPSKSRETKPATRPHDYAKTPSPLPPSEKGSQSNATPLPPMLESPPLISTLSPASVQTPVMNSSTPKVEPLKLVDEKPKTTTIPKPSSGSTTGGINKEAPKTTEAKAPNVEKPGVKPAVALPPQSGPPRPGAGRGAKNLAALMARASESTSQKSSAQGGAKTDSTSTSRTSALSASTNAETKTPNPQKPSTSNPEQKPRESQQTATDPSSSTDNGNQAASAAGGGGADKKLDGAPGKDRLPIPPQQQAPIAPVRRGKGKGFGSKDLAAMRARSMATATQTGGGADEKKST